MRFLDNSFCGEIAFNGDMMKTIIKNDDLYLLCFAALKYSKHRRTMMPSAICKVIWEKRKSFRLPHLERIIEEIGCCIEDNEDKINRETFRETYTKMNEFLELVKKKIDYGSKKPPVR